jgi:hypothetical protein
MGKMSNADDERGNGTVSYLVALDSDLDELRRRVSELERVKASDLATPTEIHDAYCDVSQGLLDHLNLTMTAIQGFTLDEWKALGGLALVAEGRASYYPEGTRHRGALDGGGED